MRKTKIKYQKKMLIFLFSVLMGICFVSGCRKDEIVFETQETVQAGDVNAQADTTKEAEQTVDGMQTANEQDTQQGADTQTESIKETEMAKQQECYVDVCGAVVTPGVYKVAAGTRIYEIILLAGGLTQEAEESCINQALPVYDGMKLIVPTKAQWEAGEFVLDENELIVRADKIQTAVKEETDGLVNINEATVEELCTLPGVGSAKAESIVAYREENGKFSSIEDIKKVAGIKEGLFEKIKSKIKV